jgi:galactitol-specific phosphotransferase system IIB component
MKMKIQELLTQRNLLINLTKTAKGKRKKEMNG